MAEASSSAAVEPKSLGHPSSRPAPVSRTSDHPSERSDPFSKPSDHQTTKHGGADPPAIGTRRRGERHNAQRGAIAGPSQPRVPQNRARYEDPSDYQNLDELSAPDPVQDRQENAGERLEDSSAMHQGGLSKRHTRGTQRSMSEQEDENLTENTAPEPIQTSDEAPGAWQRTNYLEEADHESQESAEPPPFGRKTDSQQPSQSSRSEKVSEFATQLYTVSYLIFFSFFGTLARLGVQWLTFYPGSPIVTPVLWANFGGSFVMGFLSEDRRMFRDEWGPRKKRSHDEEKADEAAAKSKHAKVKKTIPLYIGLATGFCGSFTSFSSFERDVFLALSNDLPTPDNHPYSGAAAPTFTSTVHRNGGYSFMALVAVILYTVILSLGALKVGAHFALLLDPYMPTIPFSFARKILDKIMVFLAFGCWLGAILLCIWPPDRPGGPSSRGSWTNEVWRGEVLFALAFAPLGCLLRFYASLKLNGLVASFPLGTFAVNIFGCAVEAMCYDIQHVPILSTSSSLAGGGRVGCQVLQGVMDGFCGCLTTVSTWVSELQGLRRRHAYTYGLATVGIGLSVMVIIMGSVRWSIGWSQTACVTMRTSN